MTAVVQQKILQFGPNMINLSGLQGIILGVASPDYYSAQEVHELNTQRGVSCISDADAGVVLLIDEGS